MLENSESALWLEQGPDTFSVPCINVTWQEKTVIYSLFLFGLSALFFAGLLLHSHNGSTRIFSYIAFSMVIFFSVFFLFSWIFEPCRSEFDLKKNVLRRYYRRNPFRKFFETSLANFEMICSSPAKFTTLVYLSSRNGLFFVARFGAEGNFRLPDGREDNLRVRELRAYLSKRLSLPDCTYL